MTKLEGYYVRGPINKEKPQQLHNPTQMIINR